jgi:predicted DNA binding CopG/RHH family protein
MMNEEHLKTKAFDKVAESHFKQDEMSISIRVSSYDLDNIILLPWSVTLEPYGA